MTHSIVHTADESAMLTSVPLENQLLARSTDDNLQDEAPFYKTSETFVTTLPCILTFEDDFIESCLDLVYGQKSSQPITINTMNQDSPPPLPTKIVATTINNILIERTDDLKLHSSSSINQQQNEILTPPSSPPPINEEEEEEEENAPLPPPPSAKKLQSFATVITPPAFDLTSTKFDTISTHESTLHGSGRQSLYSRATGSTSSITIHNNNSQLDLQQEQPLPPIPQHQQPSQEKHELYYTSFDSPLSDLPLKLTKVNMIGTSMMDDDGDYYPDSSAYAASITKPAPNPVSLKKYHPDFPPITLDQLYQFRQQAETMPHDSALQLQFAMYLMEAVDQVWIEDHARSHKAKTAMLGEAQRIVKTLAMMKSSKIGRLGYAEAQFYLANAYGAGLMLLEQSHDKAFHLYLQGSKQCHAECTYRVGVCYELGLGTRKDHARAIRFFRKAAKLGDPSAMYKLATVLLHGHLGQEKHPKEAISWLKRAVPLADAFHPQILHELGLAYEAHDGVVLPSVIPDLDYARELFTKAALFGYAPSQYKLGLAYENGLWHLPVDSRRSIAWYKKAAEQGHLESILAISGWYLTGAPILPQDDSQAYLWAKRAADAGYAKGQYACGYYYETGIGVQQDWGMARQWYERAAKQRYAKAISRLVNMKRMQHSSPKQTPDNRNSCQIM
ncbi:hypothetical protein BC941DRAFT_476309 [Chlamydoabsidia padenii]|nr:hypothetical protein BC941DRAFT_476309 [Chlamydoabsidia padenii]